MEVLGVAIVLAIPILFIWMLVKVVAHGPRIGELQRRIDEQTEYIRALTVRVYELEKHGVPAASAPPATEPQPETAIAETLPHPYIQPEPEPEPVPQFQLQPYPEPEPEPVPVAAYIPAIDDPPASPVTPPAPSAPRDWEAIVGGSWLNAIGTVILVVAISLFLGYALTQFGPLGKIAIGALTSIVMILAGIVVERQERYAIAGRGLIAGGWAALYLTAYAAHGLPAAQVITSPIVGGLLLLAVASGMILHSLRYQSQNLTLLAYASAYVALVLGPLSTFGIAASLPLTMSLLAVARAMQWRLVPIAGMLLTYWTFAFRYDPSEVPPAMGTIALIAYWLCFEIYDILRLRAAWKALLPADGLFLLNTLLFFGTAFMVIPPGSRIDSANFLTVMGGFYLASALLRLHWSTEPEADTDGAAGSSPFATAQQFAMGIAAALFAISILRRFDDPVAAQAGLLLEAQLLVIAGLRSRVPFLRHLGAVLFAFCALLLPMPGVEFGGNWRPFAFLMPALFYANRWLTGEGRYYTWGAVPLLGAALIETGDRHWAGTALALYAALLAEAWRFLNWREFRYQSAVVAFFAVFGTLAGHSQWMPIAVSAALLYATAWRQHPTDPHLRDYANGAGLLFAACAVFHGLPSPWIAPAWGLLALATLELSRVLASSLIEAQAHLLASAGFLRLSSANFPLSATTAGISQRLLTVLPILGFAFHGWQRARLLFVDRAYCWMLTLLAATLLHFELRQTVGAAGWAALLVVLVFFGTRRANLDLQLQAYLLAVFTFLRAWFVSFPSTTPLLGLPERVVVGALVIAAFHAAQFLILREDRYPRSGFAILGSALLSILLVYQIRGGLLTIAWGMQAAALLIAGFAVRERVMRLAGLFLILICVLKLFLYDLRNLETLNRILSFAVLGLVLMGVSTLYMRFKDKIQRFF